MEKYGALLNENNLKLGRYYFNQAIKLMGIKLIYRAPKPSKARTMYGELDTKYQPPEFVYGILTENTDQRTMRKLGWSSQLQTDSITLQVPYDLHDLQVGSLFEIPSAIDGAKGRVFMVTELSTAFIYPSSVVCLLVPYYEDDFIQSDYEYSNSNFNLLAGED
jgi:hypothetical protein